MQQTEQTNKLPAICFSITRSITLEIFFQIPSKLNQVIRSSSLEKQSDHGLFVCFPQTNICIFDIAN